MALASGGIWPVRYAKHNKFDWFRSLPTWVLLLVADGDEFAIGELGGRAHSPLTDGEAAWIIRKALIAHQGHSPRGVISAWGDVLSVFDEHGKLSDADRRQFYDQMFVPQVEVRQFVRQGDPLVVEVSVAERTPLYRLDYVLFGKVDHLDISGHELLKPSQEWDWKFLDELYGGMPALAIDIPEGIGSGQHTLTCRLLIKKHCRYWGPPPLPDAGSEVVTFVKSVEIRPPDAPDPIRLLDAARLESNLQGTVRVSYLSLNSHGGVRVGLALDEPAPFCLPVDVFVEDAGHEAYVGSAIWSRDEAGTRDLQSLIADWVLQFEELPKEVSVILRPNRELAIRSVDCYDLLDGVVNLGRVKAEIYRRQHGGD